MLVAQSIDKNALEQAQRRMLMDTPFKEWAERLSRGDTLPRGRNFKGKKPGRPIHIIDEFHQAFQPLRLGE